MKLADFAGLGRGGLDVVWGGLVVAAVCENFNQVISSDMATLKIYRSSAGAGKTHTLVSAYLKLALESSEAFTQILAVTFTNQATQEMKHRILVYLHDLAQGMPNALAATLLREGRWDKDTLQVRARAVLSAMLHQYTRFSVSTIDSFLQKVIRGFAQELGLQSKFRVELEQAPVLEKLIDDLVIAAGHDEQLQQWLVAFAEDKLLNGKQWNLKRDLTGLGYEIFKESFGVYEASLVAATSDRAALQHLLERLHACIGYFETHLQGLGQQALQAIQQAGLEVSDFAYGKAGAAGYLTGLATKRQWTPTLRALRALGHVPMWYARASDKQQEIACVVQDHLQPCLQAVVQFYDTHHRTYYAALAVKHFVYALGIVTQLLERLNDYRATYNVMLVSDTTQFLRKIIAENETPFVYEKIGAFYKHFLIDEFQDVSGAQWHSFQPLIENGLNEGHESMVVGDVKQSIYRWRGGDWRLLLSQLEKDVRQTAAVSLDQNWRSKPHIVAFNNAFFTAAARVLVQHFTEKLEAIEEPALKVDLLAQARQLGSAYKDVHQTVPPQRMQADQGYVKVTLLEDTDGEEQGWREEAKGRVFRLIETLQEDNFALKDIALLVRSNAEARDFFQALLAYQQSSQARPGCRYDVISAESLYLGHNPWVNLLISALRWLANEEDSLARAELIYLYQVHVLQEATTSLGDSQQADDGMLPAELIDQRFQLLQLPLYELLETLIRLLQIRQAAALPFLQALQDVVLRFAAEEEADIPSFLHWWEVRGARHTLPRAEGQEAMTLMTIHQAKGLQYKVVILPFGEWDLDHNVHRPPTLWCVTDAAPLADFPVLPVRYSSRLQDTVYARNYYEEHMQAYLDHLNLLYVALTRPEDRLYVFTRRPTKVALKNTADLLYQTLEQLSNAAAVPLGQAWDLATNVLELGSPLPQELAAVPEVSVDAQQHFTSAWPPPLAQEGLKTFDAVAPESTQLRYGRMVHRLLEQLTSLDVLPTVLANFRVQEDIGQEELDQVEQQLITILRHPLVKDWFSDAWDVRSEATILSSTGQVLRPDRVLLKPGRAVVIDFKTGGQHIQDKGQVQDYMALLRAMGHAQVEGYLLYLDGGTVVAC